MKKKDLILAGGILLLAGLLALGLYLRKPENGNLLKITVDGEVYGTYALSKNQTIPIETSHGTNQLVIKNGKAHGCNCKIKSKNMEREGMKKNEKQPCCKQKNCIMCHVNGTCHDLQLCGGADSHQFWCTGN